jgi:hypothetical protein
MKPGVIRVVTALVVVTVSATLVLAGAVISEFRGEPGYNKVVLTWVSESEQDLKGYEIERSFREDRDYQKVAFVKAKGTPNGKTKYTYEDDSVFKTSNGRTYYYRLKIVNNDGTSSYYKVKVSVTPVISSARQTWGSIKAMFR